MDFSISEFWTQALFKIGVSVNNRTGNNVDPDEMACKLTSHLIWICIAYKSMCIGLQEWKG